MSGLFSTFNIAKSGLNVSQRAIDVTSHNISNVETEGYSRQRVNVKTSRPATISALNGQLGTGAQVSTIERIRDNFLDYQVRGEKATYGKYQTQEAFLSEIESIFNEPSETGISNLIGKFFDSFQELSKQPNSSNARTVVAQQTSSLCEVLNRTYSKLEDLQTNSQNSIRSDVKNINSLVDQLNSINKEIVNISVTGNIPNDLMDKRDLLLDELSCKINIKVENKEFNGIEIQLEDSYPMKNALLVSNGEESELSRFSYVTDLTKDPYDLTGKTYTLTYYRNGDMTNADNKEVITLTNVTEEMAEKIKQNRVIWGDSQGFAVKADGYKINGSAPIQCSDLVLCSPRSGELNGNIAIQDSIKQYMSDLNKLAKGLALAVNTIHSGMSSAIDYNGNPGVDALPFFVNSERASYGVSDKLMNVEDTLRSETDINAKNISINKEILSDVMKIKTKTNDYRFSYTSENNIDGEGDGERALAIAKLRDSLIRIQDVGTTVLSRSDMFNINIGGSQLDGNNMYIMNAQNGTKIDSFFKDTIDRLGVESQQSSRMVANEEEVLFSLESTRLSVAGVSLDEEMSNLIQFQHAYNANAKVISTVDELLDVVINSLKR